MKTSEKETLTFGTEKNSKKHVKTKKTDEHPDQTKIQRRDRSKFKNDRPELQTNTFPLPLPSRERN